MIEILWLNERMLHCAELAQWIHAQFPYEFREQALENWQAELASGQLDGSWQSLIAVEGEHLLGSASLARDDLPSRPELSPWLACVYVRPECRGRGLAECLIEAICAQARSIPFVAPGFTTDARVLATKKLLEIVPKGIEKFFYATSGTEANEAAIKAARLYTGKHRIISRYKSYHGATAAGMSCTGDPRRWAAEPQHGGAA